jgi:uncharacterized membrane protein YkoI
LEDSVRRTGKGRQFVAGAGRVLVLALLLAAGTTRAAPETWLASAIDLLEQRPGSSPVLSINDAASRAQNRFGGQVISISPAEQDGRRGYRVKILLESGRVKTLFVESRTGNVIDRRARNP